MGGEEGRDEGEKGRKDRTEWGGKETRGERKDTQMGCYFQLTVCGYISHQELHHCHYLL